MRKLKLTVLPKGTQFINGTDSKSVWMIVSLKIFDHTACLFRKASSNDLGNTSETYTQNVLIRHATHKATEI